MNQARWELQKPLASGWSSHPLRAEALRKVESYLEEQLSTGKPAGHDSACGVYTLPVIYALGSSGWGHRLRSLLAMPDGDRREVREQVIQIVRESGSLDRASHVAERHAARARRCLAPLPDGPGKEMLGDILASAIHRTR